jgi:hypothetical protein
MTDDEIERALFALPLEEPPAGLHARILAATINHPRQIFRAWEIWAIGTLLAVMCWLGFQIFAMPHAADRLVQSTAYALDQLGHAMSSSLGLWALLGLSTAAWLSFISMPASRSRATDH